MAIKDKYLLFKGSDGYINAGRDADAYRVARTLTLEAWVNADTYAGDGRQMGIVSKLRTDGGPSSGYGLLLSDGKLIFRIYGKDGALKEVMSDSSVVPAGAWHHVSATYDGTTLRLYVDGSAKGTKPVAAADIEYSNEGDLYIGRAAGANGYFKGSLCEVRIWDLARSVDELNNNKERALDASVLNLRARWPLDDGVLSANDVRNGLNATVYGGVELRPAAPVFSAPQPDMKRPSGHIDTSGVLAAALDKLNRQSAMGLLKKLTEQIKAQTEKLDGQADKLTGLRTDLDAHTNTNHHNQLIDTRVNQAISNLLTQEQFKTVAENLDRLQKQLEIVRTAALALDTNELSAVQQAINDALKHPDVAKQILGATIPVNGVNVQFADLLNKLARRVEVIGTTFTFSATDITGATFKLSDTTDVTFTASSSKEENAVNYTFKTPNLYGLPAEFLVKFTKSSSPSTLNAGQPDEQTLNFDEYQPNYHSNVYYDLKIN